ncbi:MAG: FtsX-like permease family protein [Clostridia bacterium]|jgi:hypothetical protein
MKWIRLIAKSVLELSKNHKIYLCVVLIGLILSEIGFLFFIGFSNGLYLRTTGNYTPFRTYTVSDLNNAQYFKSIDLLKKSNMYRTKDFIVKTADVETDAGLAKIISSTTDKVSGTFSGRSSKMTLRSKNNKSGCVITRNLVNLNKKLNNIGLDFNINSKQFVIEGIIDLASGFETSPMVFIPFKQFKDMNVKIETLSIITDQMLSENQFDLLKNDVASISSSAVWEDDNKIKLTKESLAQISNSYIQRNLLYFLLTTISIINSLFLLRFWLEKRKKEFLCYKICGGTYKKLFIIIFVEIISLVIFTEIISVAIFELFARKLFIRNGINIILGLREYSLAVSISILVASITLSYIIIRFLNRNKYRRATL